MKKTVLLTALFFTTLLLAAQHQTISVKAFQRGYSSGVAATTIIEMGGKETIAKPLKTAPEYLIYLVAHEVTSIKVEGVWIKQQLYQTSIVQLANTPVTVQNGKQYDTLIRHTGDGVWQIQISGMGKKNAKPKKDIKALIAANELVVCLRDKKGQRYIKSIKRFTTLEPGKGQ